MTESTIATAAVKPGIHLLPLNLGRLAAHTDRSAGRFATDAVRVEFGPDNTFRAEVTDTKHAVVIDGPCVADPNEFPDVPAIMHAPNGKTSALVPGTAWAKMFASANKIKYRTYGNPLKAVACVVGENVTTFAATNGETTACDSTMNIDGKFPPIGDIIKKTRGEQGDAGAKFVKFAIDAVMLAEIMKTAAGFCGDGQKRVEFEVIISDDSKKASVRPIIMTAHDDKGHRMTALLMPLSS